MTKAYTDIELSKTLAKILPIESADMSWYKETKMFPFELHTLPYTKHFVRNDMDDELLPCWSLAALLELIQDDIKIEKTLFDQSDLFTYSILSDTFDYRTYEHEELIDACVEMIVKLKEKGLI